MELPQRKPRAQFLFLAVALVWPRCCVSLGELGSRDWMYQAAPQGLGYLLE